MKILVACFLLLILGLASAAPRSLSLDYPFDTPLKGQSDDVATSEFYDPTGLILGIAKLGASGVIKLLRLAVCDNTADSQLQSFADNEEENAQIMALVKVMNDLITAEEKLDKIKQLTMKGNLVAEAELFDGQWVDTLKNKLKSAVHKIGSATKKLLCNKKC